MCGIAGIINSPARQGNADSITLMQELLNSMTDSLRHRGPDGQDTFIDDSGLTGLGHCRLAIIDLSDAGKQPMHYLDRYTIVHNGEIYNYLELKEELKKAGYSFRSSSDTEVILAAYDHYGEECVDHFDGMFAFAIWDQHDKELFAARDRFGEKPFYYFFNNDRFVFASEMKALWQSGIQRRLNQQMLFNFITIGYTDNPGKPEETFYENIFRLPASSTLYYIPATNELTISKYWDIDPSVQNKAISDEEAIEKFNWLFSASVSRRLRSDVPIGTSLSGGIDSSSVIAVSSSLLSPGSEFNSFTAIFPGFEKDEWPFASQVAHQFKLCEHTTPVSVDDFIQGWDKLVVAQEEPFNSASAFAQFQVFKLAKEHNVKVLLDGQGADETLAGYSRYYKWYWQELFQKRRLVRSKELQAAREMGVQEPFTFRNVIASLVPDIASVILEHQYLVNALRHPDLTREFVQLQSKEAYYSTPPNFNLNGVLYFNTCIHGLEELLKIADRNSMAHGREVRLPFLEPKLVEFIFSLPSNFKIRHAWTKWILRQAMNNKLPDSITWRKDKVGFEPPQQAWVRDSRVQEMIQAARQKLVSEKILKPEVLNRPIDAQGSHAPNNYDWRYLTASAYL